MNDNLVKTLREKTEETDLDTILKTTFGGYSRKSVREYISMMRQQQYDLQQSFSRELQQAQAERDRLARELAEVSQRAASAEEALDRAQPLIQKVIGLESDLEEAIGRIQADADLLEQLRQENAVLKQEAAQHPARQPIPECAPPQTAPSPERPETTNANPANQPEALQMQLAILTRERENIARRMESITRQEKSLFQALNECRAELENRWEQNQCMEAENEELSRRLSEQVLQNISLNREITHMRTINENLKRKLTAVEAETVHLNAVDAAQNTGNVLPWSFEE